MEFASRRQPPEEWVGWLDGWVRELRVSGASDRTIGVWWYLVSQFALAAGKPPEQVNDHDILAWLGRGVGRNSMRSDRNALSSFFRCAQKYGWRKDNPVEHVPRTRRDRRRQLPASDEAVARGLGSRDWRVRLAVMLAADAGLRRREISVARTDDVIDEPAGRSLVVHGKGSKDRIVPLSETLAAEIATRPAGWLFPSGLSGSGHLTEDTVYALIKDATGCPPHAFRRRFATDVWHATGDAVQVQGLLGHESLATTQAYIFSGQEDLRRAVDALGRYRSRTVIGRGRPDKLLRAYDVPDSIIAMVLGHDIRQ